MAAVTKITDLYLGQISTPSVPVWKLARKISDSDTSIIMNAEPAQTDGSAITKDFLFAIKRSDGYAETMICTSYTGTTLTVTRGIALNGLDYTTSNADLAVSHEQGEEAVTNVAAFLLQQYQSALLGEIGSTIKFSSKPTWMTTESNVAATVPVYANSTARDAGITAPANGMKIYNTADGVFQKYEGGAWVNEGSATTPNGSTAVAGKFEEATQAEIDAATAVGGTGADLVVNPASLATSIYGTRLPSAAEKTYLTDLQTSGTTVAEIDQALDGISANVTAANLNTLTASTTSNADLLHTHNMVRLTDIFTGTSSAPSSITKTFTISAGELTVGSAMRIIFGFDETAGGPGGAGTVTATLTFGGQTLGSFGMSGPMTGSPPCQRFKAVVDLYNNATSAQNGWFSANGGSGTSGSYSTAYSTMTPFSSTVNTSNSNDVVISISGSGSYGYTLYPVSIEILK